MEDFVSGKAHGLVDDDILNPVLGDGKYAENLPLFGGLSIWDANPRIVETLQAAGSLMDVQKLSHSYMHCWRHKTPVIYRATSQWFAGMDIHPIAGGPNRKRVVKGKRGSGHVDLGGRRII